MTYLSHYLYRKNLLLSSTFSILRSVIICFSLSFLSLNSSEYTPMIQIFDSAEELGEACAREIVDLIIKNQTDQKATVLGLATGSTPIPVYKSLTNIIRKEHIDLSQLITFNLDEYVGIPPEHPQSYHYFMFVHLFEGLLQSLDNPCGIRRENIHIPNGYAKTESDLSKLELETLYRHSPERKSDTLLTKEEEFWILQQRASEYDKCICELGPIDIQILGIGTNGHIGFAEPGSSFIGGSSIIRLTESTRKDNARFFGNNPSAVPPYAITMGIQTILQAKKIILLAAGTNKAQIIKEIFRNPITTNIPATALRLHPQVRVLLDKTAASYLAAQNNQ